MEGSLRTYLGTAPGVGKTYAMLADGRQRAAAGERVVVGWIERKGRAGTRGQLGDLEVIPPRMITYRGSTFADFDVVTSIASGASLVLIDELAHATLGAARQRWEDVAEVLAAGIDVSTTANVANLRSFATMRPASPGSEPLSTCRTSSCGRARSYWSTCRLRPCADGSVQAPCSPPTRSAEPWPTTFEPPISKRSVNLGERGWMELSKSWATTSSSAEDCYQNQRQSLSSLGILARCGVSGLSIAQLKSREEDAQLVVIHVNGGGGSAATSRSTP